jgi:hypothetical protein
MRLFKIVIILLFVIIQVTCGKKSSISPAPEAAVLLAPLKDEVCITGKVISDSESAIDFKWSPAVNAETYELSIKNLLTGLITSHATNLTSFEVSLKRNTPYSWFVTSKSTKTSITAVTSIWKFYNAGLGTTSYPPYPAEIVSPSLGQLITSNNGKITLQWRGLDPDNDIINYDIYLGTSINVTLFKSQHTITSLADVPVNVNTRYFWKVISRDVKGNTSESGLYEFKTN